MTVQEQYDHLVETIRGYNPGADFAMIEKAYRYAVLHHGEQKRKDGSPYVTHPIAVAQIVADELHLDSESIVASLLHDCIEDTDATYENISKEFSPTIANLVEGVSKLTRVVYTTKEEEQMENLRKMLMAMSKDIRVILIKIADRTHNMRTMEYQSKEKQRQKSLETMEIYAPIAHRLGMQRIKWELEDTSLKYLDPVAYEEIESSLESKREEYDAFLARVTKQIEDRLRDMHVPFRRVYGRMKHPYSIYRKMYVQQKTMAEVLDLFAFRVIVDTVADCYNVLGIIHDLYRPLLGRFKDYIGTPKPNMYQSLHTTVIGKSGIPFEVQIRTQEMHEVAEYGIAAHWKYKSGVNGEADEGTYEWVRKLLENQENTDAEEFIHTLKVDMFADEVFVFSPAGDVTNLPAGATPIDFAYSVHSAVGNRMVGAKVNGRIVPLDYQLQNGEIVEILTSKTARGPSRDWLRIAQSSEARSKIRQWFKKEKREENIVNGRSAFEAELRHVGVALSAVQGTELETALLKKLPYNTIEDMYAAIGYGGFTAQKAVTRINEELTRLKRQQQSDKDEPEEEAKPVVPVRPQRSKSEQGIVVEGLSNCLVKFSKCCTPVPGDEIVGFITRGYGVSVHRADCPNAAPERRKPEEEARWIKVSWGDDVREAYATALDVYAKDRINLVLDISTALSTTQIRVQSLNANILPDSTALVRLSVMVSDSEQLASLMRKLNQISGVMRVERPAG
ncbi:MAG: bifunctional (p)ppGpp synthetase/guanosine-3',5'-bis(diphosphate) 3'-pyrophosphohydrolase [Ruminococcaceae bacterium]|jgi:GTP pyrophosphokinase|nr:bifunctional (p)ppGpp synthetase/guanosine-3',5'-bis(diphosphate) 3'-pyrophosphohydrolase [Oscillospiraceae bacterium]